jgi:glycosyltransferase involved in cell wall biosynthesis
MLNDGVIGSPEYQAYQRARDAVLRMKAGLAASGDGSDPSAYWTGELESIDYLIDASPLIVRKLRHHAFHVTGVRPYDYRDKHDGRRQHFEARLAALRACGGDALLVPESPALGGFGFEIDGRLFNIDTLKFYEVLIGMERAGVLDAMRAKDRPLVCEIGAGWAGFAYQFKTIVPTATLVIVDFPEMFLLSATYLGAVFPEARLVFAGAASDAPESVNRQSSIVNSSRPVLDRWREADFIFLPEAWKDRLAALPLDLVVNMVSFQEMTDAQVRGYAVAAAAAGCPLIYSLNRERSLFNPELVGVSAALSDFFSLTDVSVLETDYTTALKGPPKPGRRGERDPSAYRHLLGRLKPPSARPAPPVARTSGPVFSERPDVAGVRTVGPVLSDRPDVTGGTRAQGAPRVALGMTLYNNARHLREALDSLLAQSYAGFRLALLDDGSTDGTAEVAREYEARDPRVRYVRHDVRQGMVAAWREVVDIALRACPSAEYFAWVSDHDRWQRRWLERLVAELDGFPDAVLAYPITRRMTETGDERFKGPRLFDTADDADLEDRWTRFCRAGVGSGDMVYGLIRVPALTEAGVFRPVLRPDRLLIAELTLAGRIRQVPEVLWFRREYGAATSVQRQRTSLFVAGQEPPGFFLPPWLQHARVLWREYAAPVPPPLPISRGRWARMLLRYMLTYGWRHLRKSETSHAIGRGIDRVIRARKITRHHYHHAVYRTLVGRRIWWGKVRRGLRKAIYHVLVCLHRIGLRGGKGETVR